jgi:hypothetical protein
MHKIIIGRFISPPEIEQLHANMIEDGTAPSLTYTSSTILRCASACDSI